MDDFKLVGKEATIKELHPLLINPQCRYIIVKTKYTIHHIEKLMPSIKDRGSIKWIAETNPCSYDNHPKILDIESNFSHIDGADLFPRLYFLSISFCEELKCWLKVRNLTITEIILPAEYSPLFNLEDHAFYKKSTHL